MALSSTGILEVRNGGSDTLNGALFNPGATMNSNLAATSATGNSPVVTSATYNFVAGDVNAWLFVKSGTNWTPGWYPIVSVAANAATLNAAIGAAILYDATFGGPKGPNTVAGCATTASPTSGSWTVDYSQQDAVQFSLTGLTTAAANAIILTASASVNMIGNGLVITGGTNFTTGYYQINSVSAGVSITVDRTCTSAAGAAGTAGVGGALASPGMAGLVASVASMAVFWKYNAAVFSASTASTNVAGGCFSFQANSISVTGYNTNRHFFNRDALRPTYQIGGSVSTASLFVGVGTGGSLSNVILDGNTQTTSKGLANTATFFTAHNCSFINFTAGGITNTNATAFYCKATGCSTVTALSVQFAIYCETYSNTITGLTATTAAVGCLSYANSGASSDGFSLTINFIDRCVAYNNGRDGIRLAGNNRNGTISNCIVETNAGWGINQTSGSGCIVLDNVASYNNTSGRVTMAGVAGSADIGAIAGSGSFFTNAGAGDFSLNNTAGAGALCRAAGFPASFPAGLTASYADVGAAQHQDSGGGGICAATRIFGLESVQVST